MVIIGHGAILLTPRMSMCQKRRLNTSGPTKLDNKRLTPIMSQPPRIEEELISIIERCGKPPWMPSRPLDAAQWWISLQKPPDDLTERPFQVPVFGANGQRWVTPYIERVSINLRRFLGMKKEDQDYIIGAAGDGVFWNGEDMPMFYRIYEETMKMKDSGRDKYIRRASQAARLLIKSHKGEI